jgi:diguanylate cyclase (GGDEF)-like protein
LLTLPPCVATGSAIEAGAGANRGTVLVMDGDAGTRSATATHLASRYHVLTASDAPSGHALAAAAKPDAALVALDLALDRDLPGANGPTLLQHWRADDRTASVPVLILAPGTAGDDLQATCLDRGAADYLQHPLHPRVLLARVDRAIRDGRERRRLEAAAQTDGLTELPNFRALDARLRQELDRARRYRTPLAMAMIDLDHLKDVNDRLGHTAGNQVLAAFARRLTRSLRVTDFAARYGGDEFAILLTHQGWREAAVFCERLRRSLITRPLFSPRADELDFPTTISVGVASHTPTSPRTSGEALLQAADAALYEAKRQGRNQVVIFERDLPAAAEGATP